MAPLAGEKWEPPPQLGPIPTHSPPHSSPRQRLSGTLSGGISAGSKRPPFSPRPVPSACPQLSSASSPQSPNEPVNHVNIMWRKGEQPARPREVSPILTRL